MARAASEPVTTAARALASGKSRLCATSIQTKIGTKNIRAAIRQEICPPVRMAAR